MADLSDLKQMLVAANRILAHEDVCDAYGHISVRNPDNPNTYFLSRSRSPELVEADDILEFNLDNSPVNPTEMPLYIERPIHGAVYSARPDVQSVVHNHVLEVLPFTVSSAKLLPVVHSARRLGPEMPVWDIRKKFGETDLLVTTNPQGADLAECLAGNRIVLMRGHGCTVTGMSIEDAVQSSIGLKRNARVLESALRMGDVTYLSQGEMESEMVGAATLRGHNRAWEYLCRRAGVPS